MAQSRLFFEKMLPKLKELKIDDLFEPYILAARSNKMSPKDLDSLEKTLRILESASSLTEGGKEIIRQALQSEIPHIDLQPKNINLSQSNILRFFKAYERILSLDPHAATPAKGAINELINKINEEGHCNAFSNYRSYLITLEKQKNASLSLKEASEKVKAYEESIINLMYQFVAGKELTKSEHETIQNYIRTIVAYQIHRVDFTTGEGGLLPESQVMIDTEDRIMEAVSLESAKENAALQSIIHFF